MSHGVLCSLYLIIREFVYNWLHETGLFMFEMIPQDRMAAVKIAIQTLLGDAVVQQTTLLTAGSLSVIVKLMIDDKAYILRVMDLAENLLNRQNQIKCLNKANELGLGPACLYSNAKDGVLITEYIQTKKIIVTRSWLGEIATSLRTLHSDDTFPEPHQPLFDYMDKLAYSLRSRELSSLLVNYLDDIDRLKAILAPRLELTSCHNDLNFTNLLYDGEKTFFIDWEAAGQEDPFFDIATICNEFITNDADVLYFITQYFDGQPTSYQQEKVLFMRQISYCYLALHYLDHAANAGLVLNQDYRLEDIPTINEWIQGHSAGKYYLKNADDYLLYAMTKVKASFEQMQTDEFSLAGNKWSENKLSALSCKP